MTSHEELVLGERYRVARLIGEGGMGRVYEATDPSGHRVAVKLVHPSLAEEMVQTLARFVQEVRTGSQVRHPNVVALLEAGIDARTRAPFVAMELLNGESAESLVERLGPIDPTVAVRIVRQAARGLAAAHAQAIVHRDVKPANLFLHREPDGSITVKVCDFGIAKSLSERGMQLTQSGLGMGTPLYMAPEQAINAKRAGARADVWSLAVTLYHLLSGTTPFDEAQSLAELLNLLSLGATPELSRVAPWIDGGLAEVVHGGLIRDVDARCPSIEAFADALEAFSGGSDEITDALLIAASREPTHRPFSRPNSWSDVEKARRSTVSDPWLGRTIGDRYRLERAVGSGGMGAVYEASPLGGGEPIAVKVMTGSISPDIGKRFVREARAAASITSDHVVRVLAIDTDAATGAPFIAMELLDGIDLHQLVRQTGPLDPDVTLHILLQACRGLEAAHAAAIIHRDVKPANIYLHFEPSGRGVVKICDFGIAKSTTEVLDATSAQLTRTGGMLGSPVYLSPEQARNAKQVDFRTDVWGVCISAYEALTGVQPWGSCSTLGELILAICTVDVEPLAARAPWVDPRLAAVIERGLRRDLDRRWSSMSELSRALEAIARAPRELRREHLRGVASDVVSVASHAGASTFAAAAISQDSPRRRRTASLVVIALSLITAAASAIIWARNRTSHVEPVPIVASEAPAIASSVATPSRIPAVTHAAPPPVDAGSARAQKPRQTPSPKRAQAPVAPSTPTAPAASAAAKPMPAPSASGPKFQVGW